MNTKEILSKIRQLDSDIDNDSGLVKTLQAQVDRKEKEREMLRAELKVAFAREHQLKQPAASHKDIY